MAWFSLLKCPGRFRRPMVLACASVVILYCWLTCPRIGARADEGMQMNQRERLVEQLVALQVDVIEFDDRPEFIGVLFLDEGVTDEQLQLVGELDHLNHVDFARVSVSLSQFETLLGMPGLNSFGWSNGPLADEFVDRMIKLRGLVYLSLDAPRLSAALCAKLLPWIASQSDLVELHLNDCELTDDELAILGPLTKITQLELEGNPISTKEPTAYWEARCTYTAMAVANENKRRRPVQPDRSSVARESLVEGGADQR